MNEELIREVFSDETYVENLFKSESWEAAQASLKEKGIDLSVEEIKTIVNKAKAAEEGELSDDELENVSGGIDVVFGIIITVGSMAIGIKHLASD